MTKRTIRCQRVLGLFGMVGMLAGGPALAGDVPPAGGEAERERVEQLLLHFGDMQGQPEKTPVKAHHRDYTVLQTVRQPENKERKVEKAVIRIISCKGGWCKAIYLPV